MAVRMKKGWVKCHRCFRIHLHLLKVDPMNTVWQNCDWCLAELGSTFAGVRKQKRIVSEELLEMGYEPR